MLTLRTSDASGSADTDTWLLDSVPCAGPSTALIALDTTADRSDAYELFVIHSDSDCRLVFSVIVATTE